MVPGFLEEVFPEGGLGEKDVGENQVEKLFNLLLPGLRSHMVPLPYLIGQSSYKL